MLLAGTGMRNVAQAIGEESEEDEEQEEATTPQEDGYGGYTVGPPPSEKKKRKKLGHGDGLDAQEATEMNRLRAMEGARADMMDEDEDATLLNVEEMLEGFEWNAKDGLAQASVKAFAANGAMTAGSGYKAADLIEARLLSELQAIEAASIHAIIESDDRVSHVIQHIEEALTQLDVMDGIMSTFKASLNARNEDISHIESQNRGLQVQTSNQRVLAEEIERLLQTIHVDDNTIAALEHASLETGEGVAQLESAAALLYKSILQAQGDGINGHLGDQVAAATERLADYHALSDRFCHRVLDFITRLLNREIGALLSDPSRQQALQPPNPNIYDHSQLESSLEAYCGILLYVKETSPSIFSRISAQYFAAISDAYRREMTTMFNIYKGQVRKASDEANAEVMFAPPASTSTAAMLRAGTVRRVGMGLRSKQQKATGEVLGGDAFTRILSSVTPLIVREQAFMSDFLHINENDVTYADYMDLEAFFRRKASALSSNSSAGPLREMKSALDLIFGFLAPEWQNLADHILQLDKM